MALSWQSRGTIAALSRPYRGPIAALSRHYRGTMVYGGTIEALWRHSATLNHVTSKA